jgi:hypothetical protein
MLCSLSGSGGAAGRTGHGRAARREKEESCREGGVLRGGRGRGEKGLAAETQRDAGCTDVAVGGCEITLKLLGWALLTAGGLLYFFFFSLLPG